MNDDWKRRISIAGGIASIAVLAMTVCNADFFHDPDSTVQRAGEYQFVPWGTDEDEEEVSVEPPEGRDQWIRFVDEEQRPVEVDALVSAPGMWPFETRTTGAAGFLDLPPPPIDKLSGDPMAMYEVVARPDGDEGAGYWGTVEGPGQKVEPSDAVKIELRESAPLTIEVVDVDGDPVEGAYIRLGRDNIGLVHLENTTGPDGIAQFDDLPPQSYHATLDAEGYAGTEVTIDHSADVSGGPSVAMQEGGGLSIPQGWRGPPVQQMVGSDSSAESSTGARAGATDADLEDGRPGGNRSAVSETDGGAAPSSTASSLRSEAGAEMADGQGLVDLEVLVVEPGRDGIGGAWLEAWADGQRVDEAVSRDGSTTTLRVPTDADVDVVASHPTAGEGEAWVGVLESSEEIAVELDRQLLSRTAAVDREPWVDEIEDILEVEIAGEGAGWFIDWLEPGGIGAEAGLREDDALVFLREEHAGYLAVVERGGELLEIPIP